MVAWWLAVPAPRYSCITALFKKMSFIFFSDLVCEMDERHRGSFDYSIGYEKMWLIWLYTCMNFFPIILYIKPWIYAFIFISTSFVQEYKCKNEVTVAIMITEQGCGNGSDAVIITSKYQSSYKISLDTVQNTVYTFRGKYRVICFENLYNATDAKRRCFYAMNYVYLFIFLISIRHQLVLFCVLLLHEVFDE